MQLSDELPTWNFNPAIDLLRILSISKPRDGASLSLIPSAQDGVSDPPLVLSQSKDADLTLGNFSKIWEFLSTSHDNSNPIKPEFLEEEVERVAKEVRWRDEISGADLEDNVDSEQYVTGSKKTQLRAARRARARERAAIVASRRIRSNDVGTETASSDEDLNHRRPSPDRRAVIQNILHPPSTQVVDPPSPPTSPSPPKASLSVLKKDRPISNPFQWSASTSHASSHRNQILPLGNFSPEQGKSKLIARLSECFPSEAKYLKNKGLIHPEFMPLNTSDSGVHVFIDISNVRSIC